MRVPDDAIVRPTFRCLVDDLGRQIGPEALRVAVRTVRAEMEADDLYCFPVHLAASEHPLLTKANEVAHQPPSARERIEVLTDRWVAKVKTGNHRGALWQDDAGTWWLLAGGIRKNDSSGDFYREFERLAGDSDPIAPTAADRRYLALETALIAEAEVEQQEQRELLSALLHAARYLDADATATVFGAGLTIRIRRLDEGSDVIEITWQLRTFDQQDRFPQDVLAMVPGLESVEDWDYVPPRAGDDRPFMWFSYVSPAWTDWLATAAELDELVGEDWEPPSPTTDGSESFSHFLAGTVATIAYVTGVEVVGLCGARVVAHRDPTHFPVCPQCIESRGLLRSLRES